MAMAVAGTSVYSAGSIDVLRHNQKWRILLIATNYLLDLEIFFRDRDFGRRQAVEWNGGRQLIALIWSDHVKMTLDLGC